MIEWVTRTPDGLVLRVRREEHTWLVSCADVDEARSELLDVALFEAIRGGAVIAHAARTEYGSWIRELADEIETLSPRRAPALGRRHRRGPRAGSCAQAGSCRLSASLEPRSLASTARPASRSRFRA